jgi:hypothetical protein
MLPSFREKRMTSRSRVFFGGNIVVDSALPKLECHVKNVSRRGACLVLQSDEFMPNQFDLIIRKTNERFHAVVAWNRGRHYGVAYRAHHSPRNWASPSELREALGIPTMQDNDH